MTFDEMFESNPDWILKQVRRLCPEPEIMKKNLEEVLATFRKSEFQFEGLPVLTSDAIKEFRTLIDVHVSKGCLSDPIGVSLYCAIGKDKHGLILYTCLRGSSALEFVHQTMNCALQAQNSFP
ncbi:hypothetical protein HK100_008922 [Physocladia obscura]|uniref:Uncharacterized protein n=1 Tax=Physocladia obscura TaxID=109957 RepID=A0AAD5XAE6_9FUNG|nr:hypothetical protein HK100_008922 [Physocladia obscura]